MKRSLYKRNSLNLICLSPPFLFGYVGAAMCCNRCYLSFWLTGLKVFSISFPQWDLSSLFCTRRMLLPAMRKTNSVFLYRRRVSVLEIFAWRFECSHLPLSILLCVDECSSRTMRPQARRQGIKAAGVTMTTPHTHTHYCQCVRKAILHISRSSVAVMSL